MPKSAKRHGGQMPTMGPMTTTLRSMNAAKGGRRRTQQSTYRGGYRYSRRYRGGQASAENMKTISGYDYAKEYKRDDIVAADTGDFYIALADSVGKEPTENPSEWRLIPKGTDADTFNVGDLAVYEQAIYKRVEPAAGEAPYEAGKGPRDNPTAWNGIASTGRLNSGRGKGNKGEETPPAEGETTTAAESTTTAAGEIQDFDNGKAYNAGDLIRYKSETGDTPHEGKIYKMTVPIGAAGYAPMAYPQHFVRMIDGPNGLKELEDFDNGKAYNAGDIIRYKSETGDTPHEGKIYKMTVPIGAAGYAPMAYPQHFTEMVDGPNGLEEAQTTTTVAAAEGGRRRRRTRRNRKTRRRRGSRRH